MHGYRPALLACAGVSLAAAVIGLLLPSATRSPAASPPGYAR
ncbi:hypothetical protein [Frankia gtarii]|nr:hypothetical protein [Frankia gtarii]